MCCLCCVHVVVLCMYMSYMCVVWLMFYVCFPYGVQQKLCTTCLLCDLGYKRWMCSSIFIEYNVLYVGCVTYVLYAKDVRCIVYNCCAVPYVYVYILIDCMYSYIYIHIAYVKHARLDICALRIM